MLHDAWGPASAAAMPVDIVKKARRWWSAWCTTVPVSVLLARLSPRFAQNTAYFKRFSLEKAAQL